MGVISKLTRSSGSFVPSGTECALSLNEMASSLPVMINEAVVEFEAEDFVRKSTLLEAACGENVTDADVISLTESVIGTVKDKIKNLFEKLIKWIQAIIEKIAQTINTFRMSGAQLVSKYKKDVQGKDYKDFSFEGFIFEGNIKSKWPMGTFNVKDWARKNNNINSPMEVEGPKPSLSDAEFKAAEEEFEKKLTTLKDATSESSEAKVAFFNSITGLDASNTSKFNELLFKALRGGKAEKKEIKAFKEMSLDTVIKTLENPEDLVDIKNDYEKLKDSVEKLKDECVKAVDSLRSGAGSNEKEARSNKLKSDYTETWSRFAVSLLDVAAIINNAKVRAAQDKAEQAKMVFIKALRYNPGKSNNNSFEDEEYSELEYSIE